jgi:hypothetical protein
VTPGEPLIRGRAQPCRRRLRQQLNDAPYAVEAERRRDSLKGDRIVCDIGGALDLQDRSLRVVLRGCRWLGPL